MENFIVSARKYRPATFETVVGQQHITGTLQNAIKNNQFTSISKVVGPFEDVRTKIVIDLSDLDQSISFWLEKT